MSGESWGIWDALSRVDPAASAATLPVIVGIGLGCGLLLWLLGSKVLRPAVAVLGGAMGSAAGILLPTSLGIQEIAGVPASLFGLGAGTVLGMLIALALYRAVLTFSTGLVFGAAALMTTLAVFAAGSVDVGAEVEQEPRAIVVPDEGGEPELREVAASGAMSFVESTWAALAGQWDRLAEESKLITLGATLGALMFGLVLGLAAPERASAVVTAALGSGLWLYCFAWLSAEERAPWAGSLDLGPRGWAIAWGVAAVVGTGAQLLLWPGRKKRAEGE